MVQVIPLGPAARMLTTREAALRLGVSLRTVQLWVEADILPAARTPGGHRRIPHNAVEALALSTGLGGEPPPRSRLRPMASGLQGEVMPVANGLARATHRALAPMDVLLVADDSDWLSEVEQALYAQMPGLTVRVAETGYLGLLQIGRTTPDLLIAQLELPGLDGIAMLHTLERCESLQGMRIMALTRRDAKEVALAGGVPPDIELIRLPVSASTLSTRVQRWVDGRMAF